MITEKQDILSLHISVNDTTSEILQLVSSFGKKEINIIPFEGSWTAAQVAEHVTKSNTGIAKEFQKKGKICEREPDAGVQHLKSVFLNFTTKLRSPEFILPTRDMYSRETVIRNLKKSIDTLKGVSKNEDLFRVIDHPIFGEVTKLEMLHFVVYHTQRHIHQLKNIIKILEDQKGKKG